MKKRAFIYIILAGILWGTSGLFFDVLDKFGFSAIQMAAMRGCVSAVAMIIYALFNKRIFKVSLKQLLIFLCSGVCVFMTSSCYYAAIGFSNVSTAVILMYTAPIFVMIYSVMFLGEKLNTLKVISVVMMIIGCALVSGIIGGMKFSFFGIALGLGSGLAYSAYNIIARIEMMRKYDSLSATLYCFISMGTIAFCASNPPQMAELIGNNPLPVIPLIIAIGLVTCVIPYFFYTLALRDIPAGTASALGIIEPMSATIFSVIFLGEVLKPASVFGIILILAAVTMLNVNKE